MPLNEDSEAIAVPLCSSAGLDAWMSLIQPCHLVTIPEGSSLNCGRCEKYLRTKLSFLRLGYEISSSIFADPRMQPLMLLRCPIFSEAKVKLFAALPGSLWRRRLRKLALLLWLRLTVARLRLAVSL